MKFSDRKEILEQREIRNQMYTRYKGRFLASTAAIVVFVIIGFLNQGNIPEKPEPPQQNLAIAETLITLEGREAAIDEKYDGAKITGERTYGKDIISVFEVGDQHSFCVFEATEEGYWMEYCGNLFPKTEMVKGTAYLGYDTHQYDIYLQHGDAYTHLVVSQTNRKYHKYKETRHVSFDENGIGIMKIDYHRHRYFKPRIEAYDAEGNQYILDKGGIF